MSFDMFMANKVAQAALDYQERDQSKHPRMTRSIPPDATTAGSSLLLLVEPSSNHMVANTPQKQAYRVVWTKLCNKSSRHLDPIRCIFRETALNLGQARGPGRTSDADKDRQ